MSASDLIQADSIYRFELEQVFHVHHSFAVAGRQQRVILAVDDGHQVPKVTAAPWRLGHGREHLTHAACR